LKHNLVCAEPQVFSDTFLISSKTVEPQYLQLTLKDKFIRLRFLIGIVFWVDDTGQHGLICSLVDISSSSTWSNITNAWVGSSAQSTWNGQGNSTAIMGQSGHTSSAAKLCDNYTNADYGTGIYTDWYLPALDECVLINQFRYILNKNIEVISGANILQNNTYLTSTECDIAGAYSIYFGLGPQGCYPKTESCYVRAVRAF
jgi:hypothetical protein